MQTQRRRGVLLLLLLLLLLPGWMLICFCSRTLPEVATKQQIERRAAQVATRIECFMHRVRGW